MKEYIEEVLEDYTHIRLFILSMIIAVAVGTGLEMITGLNDSSFKGVLVASSIFMSVLAMLVKASSNMKEDADLAIQDAKAYEKEALTLKEAVKAIAEQTRDKAGEIDRLTTEIVTLRKDEQMQIKKMQLLKEELATANDDLANANKGLASADKLLANAGRDLANAKEQLANAQEENAIVKKQLATAKELAPYRDFFDAFVAVKEADSVHRSFVALNDKEGKGNAKEVLDKAKKRLEDVFEELKQ